jgi:hypothetical protein
MKPRRDDVAFVRAHLATLSERGTPQQQIDDALALLGTLETHQHE